MVNEEVNGVKYASCKIELKDKSDTKYWIIDKRTPVYICCEWGKYNYKHSL